MPLTDHQKSVIDTCRSELIKAAAIRNGDTHFEIGVMVAAQLVDLNASMETIAFKLEELVNAINSRP
jgi:hypothetical protein